jgi:hypothetical protein
MPKVQPIDDPFLRTVINHRKVMEGGYLPWKINKGTVGINVADMTNCSLPPPPEGYFWSNENAGNWKLEKSQERDAAALSSKEPELVDAPSSYKVHEILPSDTIPGVCLQYRITPVNLRRANLFSGNSIHHLKTLIIPIGRKGSHDLPKQDSRGSVLQHFQSITGESREEATIYLEDSSWDLNAALTAWRLDENWDGEISPDAAQRNSLVFNHSQTINNHDLQDEIQTLQVPASAGREQVDTQLRRRKVGAGVPVPS